MSTSISKKHKSTFQPVVRWIRPDKRLAIYLRDRFTCQYCGTDLHGEDVQNITLDHLVAKSKGGSNHEKNLVTCCRSCNCSRQDTALSLFVTKRQAKQIRRNTRRNLKSYRKLAKAIMAGEIECTPNNY